MPQIVPNVNPALKLFAGLASLATAFSNQATTRAGPTTKTLAKLPYAVVVPL
jgi:hypothetical protein